MRAVESTNVGARMDVESIREVLGDHPVRLAVLFGSYATGSPHEGSDIDIAVAFEGVKPSEAGYNDAFLGLSADLSQTLRTDDVDLVDLHTVSPSLAAAIFESGVLLVGDQTDVSALRDQVTTAGQDDESPRERLDGALARIDAHLDRGTGVPAAGRDEDEQ